MKTVRRTAKELVAIHLGYDITEMNDYRYQPTRHVRPALFTIGDYYYCAPMGYSLPKEWKWELVGTYYDRNVYRAHMNDTTE